MADTRFRGNVSEKSIDSQGREVLEKVFRSKELLGDHQVIGLLKKSLSDSRVVDTVYEYYKKRLELIREKSNKFKRGLLQKYSFATLSTPEIIEKSKKYAKKYNLSEGEINMFINMVLNDPMNPNQNMYNVPATPMSRTLGYSADAVMGDKLQLGEHDFPAFKEIMALHDDSEQMHRQLVLQSLLYKDCGADAMNGTFDKNKHNAFNYVHPVVAALFLPKVPYVDERMLIASIPGIVKNKSESKPIITQPDFELYWDLITDPNATVCVTDNTKTVEDLRNRSRLQVKLWESVMNLRQGKYYVDNLPKFINCIKDCSSSIFDAPDLVYSSDEGTILRRILNAFSFRPTIVSISTLVNSGTNLVSTISVSPANYTQITSVPMVNLRLPHHNLPASTLTQVSLSSALNQPQWFIEGKVLVPKSQTIIFSRNVIFFYIDRRYKAINYTLLNRPYIFSGLPQTLTGLDSINETYVEAPIDDMTVGNETFDLRSVVFCEVNTIDAKNNTKVITGCTTGIVLRPTPENGLTSNEYFLYDPQGAGFLHKLPDGTVTSIAPISGLHDVGLGPGVEKAFLPLVHYRGSIFMYVKRLN